MSLGNATSGIPYEVRDQIMTRKVEISFYLVVRTRIFGKKTNVSFQITWKQCQGDCVGRQGLALPKNFQNMIPIVVKF